MNSGTCTSENATHESCHYDVLVTSDEAFETEGDEDIEDMMSVGATLTVATRAEDPSRFQPPALRVDQDADKKWRTKFTVEELAEADVELAKSILLDNVASYAAFRGTVKPNQTMQYQRTNPASIWFFAPKADGLLQVVDCDPSEPRGLPDLSHCLSVFRPLYAKAREEG